MHKPAIITLKTLFAAILCFTGCVDDPVSDPPIIIVNQTGTVQLEPGVTEYTLTGSVESMTGLWEVTILEFKDDEYLPLQAETEFINPNFYRFTYHITDLYTEITLAVAAIDINYEASISEHITIVYTPGTGTALSASPGYD